MRSVHACQYPTVVSSADREPTLLGLAVALVLFEFFRSSLSLYCRVTPGPGKVEGHGLAEQLESVDLVDGVLGRLDAVEDDESLSLALQARLGDNVDDGSIFFKDLAQCFDELGDLDALRQVSGLDVAAVSILESRAW